jgi:gluconolactonase
MSNRWAHQGISNSAMYEIYDHRFAAMVLPNAALEVLAEGFRWLEGPVWFADHNCLLLSDIPNDRVIRWCEDGVSVFREPAGFSNGHARDMQGRLISCSHQLRCITRTEFDGRITVLADQYEGKRLNSPNDVVVKSDGSIWFTDPPYGINTDYEGGKQTAELSANVYRLDVDGTLSIVADDFDGPNGLCFSPDEQRLYITETGVQFSATPRNGIRRFRLAAGGKTLINVKEFHKISPGMADGLRCDAAGNIWSSAGDGVHCISADGTLLGKILVPSTVSNIAFGGRNLCRLFICAGQTLYGIYTNVRGAAVI